MKRTSTGGNTLLRGLVSLLLPLLLLWLLLKKVPLIKMSFTKNEIYKQILDLLIFEGFTPLTARIILSQAAHETGNFTSKILRENKNLFGMKLPEKRPTLAVGEKNGFAVFLNINDCVADYRLYYNYMGYPESWNSIETFVNAFKMKSYFEAPIAEYLQGVTHFHKLYFNV